MDSFYPVYGICTKALSVGLLTHKGLRCVCFTCVRMSLCAQKPQGRICLVRGKNKRTCQGLPWCNTVLAFRAPKASPRPAGWIDPWTLSATSWTSLSFSLSFFCVLFLPLSLCLSSNVPPIPSALTPIAFTKRHQRAGSSQMACPLLHIASGQVLFLSLTVWLSFTKPRRTPIAQGQAYTLTLAHTHTLAPSWRVPLWDLRRLLQLLSEPCCHYEETQCLLITDPLLPPKPHTPSLPLRRNTHTHSQKKHMGRYSELLSKAGKGVLNFKWMIYSSSLYILKGCSFFLLG